jgi:hypothetical protein
LENKLPILQLRSGYKLARIIVYVLLGRVLYIQPLNMELTEGSETSENHNLTPGKYPKENIQYSKHGKSLKSRIARINSGPFPVKEKMFNLWIFMYGRLIIMELVC